MVKVVGTLFVLYVLVIVGVRLYFSPERLGKFVGEQISDGRAGRVEIGRAEWNFWDLALLRRHWKVEVHDVQIYDPSNKVVLAIPHVTAVLQPFGLIDSELVVDHANIDQGATVLVQEYPTPGGERPTAVGLVEAFRPREREVIAPHEMNRGGFRIELKRADLSRVFLQLHFLEWQADLHDLSAQSAYLLFAPTDNPFVPLFIYDLAPSAPRATLDVAGQHFDLLDFKANRFGQLRDNAHDMMWDATLRTVEGAQVKTTGALTDVNDPAPDTGGVRLDLVADRAGGLVERLSQGKAWGDEVWIHAKLDGPYKGITYDVHAKGIHADAAGTPVVLRELAASYADVDGTGGGELRNLRVEALDGGLTARGTFTVEKTRPEPEVRVRRLTGANLEIDVDPPMNVRSFVPPDVVKVTRGTTLDGKVRVTASAIDHADAAFVGMRLGQARLTGKVALRGDELRPENLVIEVPEGSVALGGKVDKKKRTMNLDFRLEGRKLTELLRRFGAPPVASRIDGSGSVDGSFDDFTARANLSVHGIPGIGTARLDVGWAQAKRRLDLHRISAKPLGGALVGKAAVRFGARSTEILHARLAAASLNLAQIPGMGGILGGRGEIDFTASGTTDDPKASLVVHGDSIILSGYDVGSAHAEIGVANRTVDITRLSIGGPASGTFEASGTVGFDKALALDLALSRLPIGMLPGARDRRDLALDGHASLKARIDGSLDAPRIDGSVDVTRFALMQTLLGAAHLELEPWPGNRLRVSGKLFQGKFTVDLSVALAAPYDVSGRVAFKRVELDEFIPGLADTVGLHGWVSGWVDVTAGPVTMAELHITESQMALERFDDRDRPVPLIVKSCGETVVAWDGQTQLATFVRPLRLTAARECNPGKGDELVVAGTAGKKKLDLTMTGRAQLGMLELYTRRWLSSARGLATVDLQVTGTPEQPKVLGRLAFENAAVRAHGHEQEIELPRGEIRLSNDEVRVSDLTVVVDRQKLAIAGSITLVAGFAPTTANISVKGRVNGKLLEILAGRWISDAGGSAAVDLSISGPALNPNVDGTMTFDEELHLSPRGLRKQLSLTRGTITFTNRELAIQDLGGTLDDARLSVNGNVRMFNWTPVDIDIHTGIEGLFYHDHDRKLKVEANADLRLTGDMHGLQLSGPESGAALTIVDALYYEPYNMVETALKPERTSERSESSLDSNPLLANMALNDLIVATSGVIRVQNKITPELILTGGLKIGGTPAKPEIEGQIRAEQGTVKLPLAAKVTFTIRNGYAVFTRGSLQPYVSLSADAQYTDPSENTHLLRLEISGRGLLKIELSSSRGLNTAQTLSLIITGRSIDDNRASARGDADIDSGNTTPIDARGDSVGGSTGVVAVGDKIIKDVTGDFMAVFIEDPIKDLTFGLVDTVRVGFGTGSFQISGSKKLARVFRYGGEYEQGYSGWSRAILTLDIKVSDYAGVGLDYFNRKPERETEDEEENLRLQLKFRFILP